MQKISYNYAQQNLSLVLDNVVDDTVTIYIKHKNGKEVALIDARKYEGLLEIAYLFGTEANAKAILRGLEQSTRKEGREIDISKISDIYSPRIKSD
jgi:PHD/YefM family antitoxin component YafN of YafNO toxin-antitoxin module